MTASRQQDPHASGGLPPASARPLAGASLRACLALLVCVCALVLGAGEGAAVARTAGAAAHARAAKRASSSQYPAGATRPAFVVSRSALAADAAARARGARASRSHKKSRKPALHGNPARALIAFQAMQRAYYIQGSGLYEGEPFSYLWPFATALAATVSLSNVPVIAPSMRRELHARLVGLHAYLDTTNSGASDGTFLSTLPAFDGTVAPPAGPGGAKYYDDNDWVGIELMRVYKLTHSAAVLGSAEGIMAFEMEGWQSDPTLGCPGGITFSNLANNTDRNTVTTAPAAELALQLYRATHAGAYLRFAEMSYEWVRACLLQPGGLYADHVNRQGQVEPTLWSYNQGTMIGAGTLLYQITHNSDYLYEARQTAKAALAYFSPQRLAEENPFFPAVYFRNLLYLDSVSHDPPGPRVAQAYVDYAWQNQRLDNNLFVVGSPAGAQLLVQSAFVQIYALLSSKPSTYF